MALTGEHAGPAQQRRRARRNALLLLLVAAAFYVGFIVMSVTKGHA